MEFFTWLARSVSRYAFDTRVLYLLVGITLSILAHELIHVLMHLGAIHSVHFFPDSSTIIALNVDFIAADSLNTEEIIAYTIMVIVQFITIIDVLAVHDSRDGKSAEQLLFGTDKILSERENDILLELVSR